MFGILLGMGIRWLFSEPDVLFWSHGSNFDQKCHSVINFTWNFTSSWGDWPAICVSFANGIRSIKSPFEWNPDVSIEILFDANFKSELF